MHNFFITGFPRTRTTWLSNFLTIGNTFCYHEPSARLKNSDLIRQELMSRPEEYVGVSDSALAYYYEPLVETLRAHRLVIIDRPKKEVKNSLMEFFAGVRVDEAKLNETLADLFKRLEFLKGKYDNLTINFEELEDEKKIEELWYYCVPGVRFDAERWRELDKMRIEPQFSKWFEIIKSGNINEIMGV